MTECGEIPQICHVFRLSIKTARVQQICTAPLLPLFAVPKIFLLSTCNLWPQLRLQANAVQQKAFKSFQNHSEGEKQPDTTSVKSQRRCGQRRQVQMQIQRI